MVPDCSLGRLIVVGIYIVGEESMCIVIDWQNSYIFFSLCVMDALAFICFKCCILNMLKQCI